MTIASVFLCIVVNAAASILPHHIWEAKKIGEVND